MAVRLKPIGEQVIVITGATSGIGLATTRRAARLGAKLVLAARNEIELTKIVAEINTSGGEAVSYALDVADRAEVEKLADSAIRRFGRIDTWINDAGIGIWGRLEDVVEADSRRMFDTNFWGVVNGSLVATKHLKENGGAIINLGSLASEVTLALQSMYSATKHAILGFTDGLRQELEMEKAPISVTLIRPAAIGTPFGEKARNYLAQEPQLPPPLYDVEEAAIGILHAASHPMRDVFIGGGSRIMTTINKLTPRLVDFVAETLMVKAELKKEPAHPRNDNLYRSASSGQERGSELGYKPMRSLYTRAVTHPTTTIGVLTAAVGVAAAVAFAMAEQRAERGFHDRLRDGAQTVSQRAEKLAQRGERQGTRLGKRVRHWADDEVVPRFEKYGRRYGKYATKWARRYNPFD